jgi:hypothetical protein
MHRACHWTGTPSFAGFSTDPLPLVRPRFNNLGYVDHTWTEKVLHGLSIAIAWSP